MTLKRRTRSELLSALRKHLWGKHSAWMKSRIKAGKAKAANNPGVIALMRDIVTGDVIPGYRKYKRSHYLAIKPIMDVLVEYLPPQVKGAWLVVDKLADKLYPK